MILCGSDASEVEEKLPLLKDKLKKSYLHQLIEERDSSSVYLVKINNFLEASTMHLWNMLTLL